MVSELQNNIDAGVWRAGTIATIFMLSSSGLKMSYRSKTLIFLVLAFFGTAFLYPPSTRAQQVPDNPGSRIALSGEPFGIVAFQLALPENWQGGEPRVSIQEKSNRTFYPAVSPVYSKILVPQERLFPQRIGRPDGLIDRLRTAVRPPMTESETTTGLQIIALFRGDDPLEIEVQGDVNARLEVAVERQPKSAEYGELLDSWWKETQAQAAGWLTQHAAHSSLAHFLTSMLARRLGLDPVELPEASSNPMDLLSLGESQPKFVELLESTLSTNHVREKAIRDVMKGPLMGDQESLELPPEPHWDPTEVPTDTPQVGADLILEEIASRVPPECFYLRFGSFGNYIWFQELGQRFGGDLASAFIPAGVNYEGMSRVERMLATRTTTVSKMFGDKLIKDMAFFGTDLFFNDGPSMAVLLHTTNPALLKASFDADRKAFLSENPDASIRQLLIGDKEASLLSTPDNRIRATMLVDGPFVIISTSQRLVERFVEIGQSQASLASTPMFHWVRSRMPASNDYSVFGYFSPEFFQQLLSPHFQIELQRRQSAIAHLEFAELASLAAKSEAAQFGALQSRVTDESNRSVELEISRSELASDIAAMRDAGLLPEWFDQRPDESRLLKEGERWIDSYRGARGSFLPIADAEIHSVSPREAADYAKTAEYFQQNWGRFDPLFFGLRRFSVDNPPADAPSRNGGQVEQFTLEAYLAPFEPTKYGWVLEQLAAPGPGAIRFPADDMLSVQVRLRGPDPTEAYYLFGGLKDMLPPHADEVQGLLKSLRLLKSAPAYVGAWPKPDLVENLPLGIGNRLARPDFAGYSRMIGGLWRWQNDEWSLLSFHKEILDSASRQMEIEQDSDSAQIRVALADLYGSQLAEWVDQLWWEQGWKSSRANAAFLDALNQQFNIPIQECQALANKILNGQIQCPLGGQYYNPSDLNEDSPTDYWRSTAWQRSSFGRDQKPIAPTDYSAPWIQWLRNARLHVTQQQSSLSVVGLVNVDLPPVPTTGPTYSSSAGPAGQQASSELLPIRDFNVFELPLKLFGKKQANRNSDAEKADSTPKRQSF